MGFDANGSFWIGAKTRPSLVIFQVFLEEIVTIPGQVLQPCPQAKAQLYC